MDQFLEYLKQTMENFCEIPWATASMEVEDGYIIKAEMGVEKTIIEMDEIPSYLRTLVIWTFSDDGKTAYIKLPKPLNFAMFTAQLMGGNLFGEGLRLA